MQARTATSDEVPALARSLAAAFEADPVFGWLIPRGSGRRGRLERFFRLELEHIVLPAGAAWTTGELPGAALTLPPGRWKTPPRVTLGHGPEAVRVFGRRTGHGLGLLTRMESRHLREPHWYFPYIGVAPAQQGRGLGRTLMEPVLDRCDRERLPAYLEATSPDNARLYRRLGFREVETVTFAGSPPLLAMRRPPA